MGKLSHQIRSALTRGGLADIAGEWIQVEPGTAFAYMTYLAAYVARRWRSGAYRLVAQGAPV